MAMRRRASFTAPSTTRRPNLSPDLKDGSSTGAVHHQQHHHHFYHHQQKPTSSNNFSASSPATSTPTSTSVEKVTPNILTVLSSILGRLIERNEQHFFPALSSINPDSRKKLTSFQGLRPPSISISKYVERIHKYTNSSLSCFVVAYIYMDRLVHQQPDQPITSMNVHRLLITSVMVAAKVADDDHFNNAYYAKVGGISNVELNRLELNLLFCLDFRVQVTAHVFESYCSHMERELHRIGYIPIQRRLPVFGDAQEPAHAQQNLKEGLDQE